MRRVILLACFLLHCLLIFGQPASFISKGVGGGGALFAPSINPANNQELYFSCDMTELFHSTNFGESYDQVHFTKFIGGANSKVNFTSTPGLLYSISYINDVPTPVKSTDNGVNWSILAGTPNNTSEDYYNITVDYANPNRVIISDYAHLFFSNNGGATFAQFHTASDTDFGTVVGGSFFDGANIYLGTNDGVITSTNGGVNWTIPAISGIPAPEGIWSFTAAKQGGVTRFFCITGNKSDIYAGMPGSDYWDFFKGLYTYDVGSGGWTSVETGISAGNDFPMFIDMAQTDISTVYLAGSNSSQEPIVMKSTNAGGQWNHVFLTTTNNNIKTGWSGRGGDRGWSYGECPFGFEVASTNANMVVFTDFGFCHKTSDGGTSWAQAYVNKTTENPAGVSTPTKKSYAGIGLENTTCWQVLWTSATNMWASFSDIKGIRSVDGGNNWSFNYSGNSANSTYRVARAADGKLFAATSNIHDMYQSTRLADNILDGPDGQGKILYSVDDGLNWQLIHDFGHPVFWIVLDPNNPERAYASVIHYANGAGIGGVYRCDNLSALAGSVWTLLPVPFSTQKHPASLNVLNDGTLVASYSGRRDGGGAFTASSGVFTYNPTSNIWADVTHPGMRYWTKDVVVDPNDNTQNTWYAGVFSGWGGPPNGLGGLYKTTNRGTSWTKLTGSIFDRVTSLTFNPLNANEVYLTTETQGLWVSKNINAVTPTFSLVSSYPFRQPERVFFNPFDTNQMWVSSFGNGLRMGLMPGALPVTILNFSSEVVEKSVAINWETSVEKGFDHFELERSLSPTKGFAHLASITPSQQRSGIYHYNDSDVQEGVTYYYRLKMIDLDQTFAYSRITSTRIPVEHAMNVFPNPAIKEITVTAGSSINSVSIINSSGILLMNKTFSAGNSQNISVQGLAKGVYVLKVSDSTGGISEKRIVLE